MKTNTLTDSRRALRMLMTGILTVTIVVALTKPAAANFKDDFKSGCQAAGNSFVENASDNSFACNGKYGGTIKCTDPDGKKQCTYSTAISQANALRGIKTGNLKIEVSKPSRPTPERDHPSTASSK